jgi:serine/threonine protein phosphatase 1
MLKKLKQLFASAPASTSAVPNGQRVYAIGDIHGRLDLLRQLHAKIEDDLTSANGLHTKVIYVGDYVDRGRESSQVIECLIESSLPCDEHVHLLGNHDAWFRRFVEDEGEPMPWLQVGGQATVLSYGVDCSSPSLDDERIEAMRTALQAKVPESHLKFLNALPLTHTVGDYLFVHAGIRPGIPLDAQDDEDLLLIRNPFLSSKADHGKVVVHGHSVSRKVEWQSNRIGIDTGAYATNCLTALVLEGADRRLLQA